MDLKHLKTFVTIAECGTVSKAAEVLHVTQPALSRQISALELDLGFKLFAKSGRRLVLTPRAERLLGDSRALLDHANTVHDRAQALRRGDIKQLKIAASPLTIETAFPRFLRYFGQRVPDIHLALVEADADQHLNMLERGEVQLSVNVIDDLDVDRDRFGCIVLPKFQIIAALSPRIKIEKNDNIDIRSLCQLPLLLLDASYATRNLFDAACKLAGVRPNVFIESASSHALIALAEEGHGVAVIPSILRTDRQKMRVLPVTLRRAPLQITLAVLWDKRRLLPTHAEKFAELFTEHIRTVFFAKPPKAKAIAVTS